MLASQREKYRFKPRLPMLSDVDSGLRIIVNYDDTLRMSLSRGPCFLLLDFGRRARARARARPPGYFNIDRKYDSNSVRVTYIRYEINYALQLVRRGTTATRLSVSRGYQVRLNSITLRCARTTCNLRLFYNKRLSL